MHVPNKGRKIPRKDRWPVRQHRAPAGNIPTIGDPHRGHSKWVWAICEWPGQDGRQPCQHRSPVALAPLVIRWGPETSSDIMRRQLRCAVCGTKGCSLQTPSHFNAEIGQEPFRPSMWDLSHGNEEAT